MNIKDYRKRLDVLKSERSSWMAHWRDLADYMLPRRALFLRTDRNQGSKRNDKIYNSIGTRSLRKLASGMGTGITSPARPWFRLVTANQDRMTSHGVREWLAQVEDRLRLAYHRSNLYNALNELYKDLGCFGIAPLAVNPDPKDLLRAHVLPIGSYSLATDAGGRVNTVYQELEMTVAQVVEKFCPASEAGVRDLSNLTDSTRSAWESKRYDLEVEVCLCIEPNWDRNPHSSSTENMPYRGVWFEVAQRGEGVPLGQEGFEEFPVMCPRWDLRDGDVYGSSPGMECLPDVKQIQVMEKRKLELVDKLSKPPILAPASMRTEAISILPGDVNWQPSTTQGDVKPIFEVPPEALRWLREEIVSKEQSISDTFYVDLFLMMAESDRRQITAEEIRARQDEKMLQLGPVLHRLHNELLSPLIERTFGILLRAGVLPPPPAELQGEELKVEFISPLALAQRLVSLGAMERTIATAQSIAQFWADVLDNLDPDKVLQEVAEITGVPPKIIRSDAQIKQIRAKRESDMRAAQAVEAMKASQPATAAVKNLAETPVGPQGGSALDALMNASGEQEMLQ